MWHSALQGLLILAVTASALAIRYALVDRAANATKPQRVYLLHSAQNRLCPPFVRRTWLVILLVVISGLLRCRENSSPPFYPYGRFYVQMATASLAPTPGPATVHYRGNGRFTVAVSPSPLR